MGYYFLVGIIYVLINIYVRRFDQDETDPLLTLAWITLWPLFFAGIISVIAQDLIYKKRKI